MNTAPKNEGTIADNELIKPRIEELFYKRLLIVGLFSLSSLHSLYPVICHCFVIH